jgi:cobalt-precorrin-5B (C1)-methyltransferase
MILILGGTTEGRLAVNTLDESGCPFYYSTRGDEQEVSLHHGIRLQGGMDAEAMEQFCRQKGIRLLVDAAHPFAEELHRNVATVGQRLQVPVIRLERIYPPRTACPVIWCAGYDEAVKKIQQSHPASLLLLTGVQSIARLAALWKDENIRCHCRILDRDSSRLLADRQGFPRERLCYYHEGEDERIVMEQLHPEAIILKESGLSGGFKEKVEVATSLGIQVFAIQRPPLPPSFITVTGRHGLRRQVEQLLPEFYPQHTGLTTGTCATAATVAAVWKALDDNTPDTFPVLLPDGEILTIPARPTERILSADGKTVVASAFTVKDAGDDPDITNGMTIEARVTLHLSSAATSTTPLSIHIDGGCGVGRVTLPGLGIEVGQAAINATPRRMIENSIRHLLHSLPMKANPVSIDVLISVPGGEEIARRTFNPRLGIEGGISIIGTSGIVKPFSTDAFIRSIAKSMEVARATGSPRVVINSGAKSERFVRAYYPELPPQAFVHYGNFIGETLKLADSLKVPRITLGVMIGKAVKLAEGHLDTHSRQVTMNRNFIISMAREAGCGEDVYTRINGITLARELWDLIPASLLPTFAQTVIDHCYHHCAPLLPHGELTILLISEDGRIYV